MPDKLILKKIKIGFDDGAVSGFENYDEHPMEFDCFQLNVEGGFVACDLAMVDDAADFHVYVQVMDDALVVKQRVHNDQVVHDRGIHESFHIEFPNHRSALRPYVSYFYLHPQASHIQHNHSRDQDVYEHDPWAFHRP